MTTQSPRGRFRILENEVANIRKRAKVPANRGAVRPRMASNSNIDATHRRFEAKKVST